MFNLTDLAAIAYINSITDNINAPLEVKDVIKKCMPPKLKLIRGYVTNKHEKLIASLQANNCNEYICWDTIGQTTTIKREYYVELLYIKLDDEIMREYDDEAGYSYFSMNVPSDLENTLVAKKLLWCAI